MPYFVLALAALPVLRANGQIDSTTHTLLGVTGGPVLANVWFSPGAASEMIQSTGVALAFRHVTNHNLGIHVEAQYAQGGWSSEGYTRTFDMLQIPVQTHLSFGKGSFRPYILGGEILTFILRGEESGAPSAFDGVAPVYKVHIGIGGGVGILKHFPHGTLQVEGRGDYHLTNLFSDDHDVLPFTISNPWSVEVTIGYLYRLGDGTATDN